jgi:hypothetical protein
MHNKRLRTGFTFGLVILLALLIASCQEQAAPTQAEPVIEKVVETVVVFETVEVKQWSFSKRWK